MKAQTPWWYLCPVRGTLVAQVMCASTMFWKGFVCPTHRPFPAEPLTLGRRVRDWRFRISECLSIPSERSPCETDSVLVTPGLYPKTQAAGLMNFYLGLTQLADCRVSCGDECT